MTLFQVRRGTAAQWASVNPVLALGEPGFDSTNLVYKVGDGVTAWASLPVNNSATFDAKYRPIADAQRTVTANTSMTATDRQIIFNGASLTATLLDPTTVTVGRTVTIKNVNATALTVVSAGSSKTIDGAASQSLVQWQSTQLVSDGTQWLTQSNIASGTATPTQVQTFLASGTWTKPAGAKSVRVEVVAPGGGGGSGARMASGTLATGGGGGGGGGYVMRLFDPTLLPATVAVTIGAVGVGGAAVTTDSTAGNAGTAPGPTYFGGLTYAASCNSAGPGAAGTSAGSAAGGGAGNSAAGAGGAGGASSATGGAGLGGGTVVTSYAGGGGAGGGGITTGAVAAAGGAGGAIGGVTAGGIGGAAGGTAGGVGPNYAYGAIAGPGAGGGGASTTTAGGAGGLGSTYGGGGGGGGASLNGFASGAGGNGGPGIIVVTTYF